MNVREEVPYTVLNVEYGISFQNVPSTAPSVIMKQNVMNVLKDTSSMRSRNVKVSHIIIFNSLNRCIKITIKSLIA